VVIVSALALVLQSWSRHFGLDLVILCTNILLDLPPEKVDAAVVTNRSAEAVKDGLSLPYSDMANLHS